MNVYKCHQVVAMSTTGYAYALIHIFNQQRQKIHIFLFEGYAYAWGKLHLIASRCIRHLQKLIMRYPKSLVGTINS
ncbi:hypothetical protein [Nostoc sp.]|uniref:hypothetical protein n=1 Tax=Nostoc sp. TaxID=1180 RepID=UPI002FFAC0F5